LTQHRLTRTFCRSMTYSYSCIQYSNCEAHRTRAAVNALRIYNLLCEFSGREHLSSGTLRSVTVSSFIISVQNSRHHALHAVSATHERHHFATPTIVTGGICLGFSKGNILRRNCLWPWPTMVFCEVYWTKLWPMEMMSKICGKTVVTTDHLI
jgi:hypothetical protein